MAPYAPDVRQPAASRCDEELGVQAVAELQARDIHALLVGGPGRFEVETARLAVRLRDLKSVPVRRDRIDLHGAPGALDTGGEAAARVGVDRGDRVEAGQQRLLQDHRGRGR